MQPTGGQSAPSSMQPETAAGLQQQAPVVYQRTLARNAKVDRADPVADAGTDRLEFVEQQPDAFGKAGPAPNDSDVVVEDINITEHSEAAAHAMPNNPQERRQMPDYGV